MAKRASSTQGEISLSFCREKSAPVVFRICSNLFWVKYVLELIARMKRSMGKNILRVIIYHRMKNWMHVFVYIFHKYFEANVFSKEG